MSTAKSVEDLRGDIRLKPGMASKASGKSLGFWRLFFAGLSGNGLTENDAAEAATISRLINEPMKSFFAGISAEGLVADNREEKNDEVKPSRFSAFLAGLAGHAAATDVRVAASDARVFTKHLTQNDFHFAVAAACAEEGKSQPDCIHVKCEAEPNVKLGEDVEIVVHMADGSEQRHLAEVVRVGEPPVRRSPEERKLVMAKIAAMREHLIRLGVDPAALTNDAGEEQNKQLQSYLILKHKETKPEGLAKPG
jgi:hypothetical protein